MMDTQSFGLSRLEKRIVEAQAVAPFFRAVAEKLGWDEALAVLTGVNEAEAFRRGVDTAERLGGNGIDELARDVDGWGVGGTWEMEVLERTPNTYSFDVTRCPYHEQYREIGLEKLGAALSCCRDHPFARGFNPRLRLVRTRTLMEGADRCDFRYTLDRP